MHYFLYCFSGQHIINKNIIIQKTTIFQGVEHCETGGVCTLDRSGRVALFHVDRDTYVQYITNQLGNPKLGVMIATRYDLPGADSIFKNRLIN